MRILRNLAWSLLLAAVHALATPLATNDWGTSDALGFVDRCLTSLPLEPGRAGIPLSSALSIALLPLLLVAAVIAAAYRSPLYARCYRYLFGPMENY
jgi:hypothetical protein